MLARWTFSFGSTPQLFTAHPHFLFAGPTVVWFINFISLKKLCLWFLLDLLILPLLYFLHLSNISSQDHRLDYLLSCWFCIFVPWTRPFFFSKWAQCMLWLFFSFGWATSWFSWLVGLPADFHNHFLFLTTVVIDLPWPYFFSRIFQRDILDFLSPTDISCSHAVGLFLRSCRWWCLFFQSWFSLPILVHSDCHGLFDVPSFAVPVPSRVSDLQWPSFFSQIFQSDILSPVPPRPARPARRFSLAYWHILRTCRWSIHFRKDQGTYSIDPADYSSVMVMWLVPLPLTLAVMPLLPILVHQQHWQHPRHVCRRQQCLRMRTAQIWSFQMVKVAPAWATSECFLTRRLFATHVSTLRGLWTLQCICYHTNCSAILRWVPELPDCMCMISYMISWSRIYDIVYDFMGLWYHKFLIS